jgi:hypothetical protein
MKILCEKYPICIHPLSCGVHTFSCNIHLILTNDEDKFIRWTKYIEFNYTGIIFNCETTINKSL